MQQIVLNRDEIEAMFKGTNFGESHKTDVGRRGLMVECVLKRAAGYHDGHTIKTICIEAGLLTENGWPRRAGVRWAFDQLYSLGGGPTMLERIQNAYMTAADRLSDMTLGI